MPSNENKAAYLRTYEGWLEEGGTSVKTKQGPELFSDSLYTHGNGMIVRIIQFNDKSDKILVTARLGIPTDIQQQFGELSEPEKRDISNDISLALTQIGVQYNIQVINGILQGVILERTVFGESMNKQIFFDNLYRVVDALVMTSTVVAKKLGGNISGSSGNPSFYG